MKYGSLRKTYGKNARKTIVNLHRRTLCPTRPTEPSLLLTYPVQSTTLCNVKPDFAYNFKSILLIPARALKAKKIFAASCALLGAYIVFTVFTYLALHLDGNTVKDIYDCHGLVPLELFTMDSTAASVVFFAGVLITLFLIMLGIMAVAAFDIEELRGNPFFSARDAIRFSLKRASQLFLSLLAVASFIGLIVLLGVVVGLITRIPFVGELLYSVFFFFPNFIIALFTIVVIFVFLLSVLVMPVTVIADRNGETFNSILETFLTLTRHPFHWAGHTLYAAVSAKVCGFIFAYFAFRAIQLLHYSSFIGGGDKISTIIASGAAHLPLNSAAVAFTVSLFPGIPFGFDITGWGAGGTDMFAGYVMTLALFAIFVVIWGYKLSVLATGQAYSFIIIKYIRDDYKIGDESSLFYEEDWVNPPLDETEDPDL